MKINFQLDTYAIHTRLAPSLFVLLPLALSAVAYFPSLTAGFRSLWVLAATCGGTFLLSEMGRDAGTKKQNALFERWGGKPSVRLLRHNGAANKVILADLHSKLRALIPTASIPTEEGEDADPQAADDVYEFCGRFLRTKTRADKRTFRLIHKENGSYGFRRNLWALKPLGISTTAISIALPLPLYWGAWHLPSPPEPLLLIVAEVINLVILLVWTFWISPSWVKIPADAYAERLLEACDALLPAQRSRRKL